MEKLLALAQHLELKHLVWDDEIYYNVSLEDFNAQSGANYEDVADMPYPNKPFLKYLENEGIKFSDEVEVNGNYYTFEGEEYLICTDDEADTYWDEDLENYIDECILPEIPERYRGYFDKAAFKSDCEVDGRGHSLASYDGVENEVKIDDTWYYLYRTN